MPDTPKTRYYAYSPNMGRRMILDIDSDQAAIDWAKRADAINVVREDGPLRSARVTVLWRADDEHRQKRSDCTAADDDDIHNEIFKVLAEHFTDHTVRDIYNATRAVIDRLNQ